MKRKKRTKVTTIKPMTATLSSDLLASSFYRSVPTNSVIETTTFTIRPTHRLSIMRQLLLLLLSTLAFSQDALKIERTVSGHTLKSTSDPAITLEVPSSFEYVGGQVFDIFHVAAAEQHLFVEPGPNRSIKRFYWFQFEHYYPENHHKYDYSAIKQQPVQVGPLNFMADARVADHYFTSDPRPGSDSEAALKLLQQKGYSTEGKYIRIRMFHLPDDSHRKELMIIYGEQLDPGTNETQVQTSATDRAVKGIKASK